MHLSHDPPFHPGIWGGLQGDFDTGENQVMPEGSGPFLPIWQMSPALPVQQLLNLDLLTFPLVSKGYQQTIDSREAVIETANNLRDPNLDFDFDDSEDIFNAFLTLGQY